MEMKWIKNIIHNGYIQLFTGLILLISVFTDLLHINIGLAGIGIVHIIMSLPNLIQGLERVDKIERDK